MHDDLETSPGKQIHWYFTKRTVWGKHVCTVNVWGWLTGPTWGARDERDGLTLDWWMVRGWYQCCCGLNGFLGKGNTFHLCFCPVAMWGGGREEVPACLAPKPGERVPYHPMMVLRQWVWPVLGQMKYPSVCGPFDRNAPWSLYDRSFFGVFWCSY